MNLSRRHRHAADLNKVYLKFSRALVGKLDVASPAVENDRPMRDEARDGLPGKVKRARGVCALVNRGRYLPLLGH